MKAKRTFGILFGAILLGLPTTGCHFPSFVPAELEKIAIEANPLKTFVAGDKFEECADYEIVGYYSDGSIKTLDKSDVELIYVSKETGVGYNIDREIPFAGDYYLTARYKGCSEEEKFEFSAVQDHIYINSISIKDCPTNSLVLGVGSPQLLYLNVEPANTTERVFFTLENGNSIFAKQLKNGLFEIETNEECNISLHLSAFNSPKHTYGSWILDLIFRNVYVSGIIPYGPQHMYVNDTEEINLRIYPENYTVDVNALSIFGNVEISKLSNTSYKITPTKAGTAFVTFFAKKNFIDYIEVTHQFLVSERYAESITSSEDFGSVELYKSKTIKLSVEPSNFTVDTSCRALTPNIVNIEKVDNLTYKITGKHLGKTLLDFSVPISNSASRSFLYEISVGHVYVRKIEAHYVPILLSGQTTAIVLSVTPINFTVNMYVDVDHEEIVSIEKKSNILFHITGLCNGSTYIRFYAASGPDDDAEEIIEITVERFKEPFKLEKFGQVPPQTNTKDGIRTLVIPLWFKDSNKYIGDGNKNSDTTKAMRGYISKDLKETFFGNAKSDGWNSVKSFYETESRGDVTITGKVTEWYQVSKKTSWYEGGGVSSQDLGLYYIGSHVCDVVNQYFKDHPSEKRTDYDYDGDGYLDSVVIVFGAATRKKGKSNFWPCNVTPWFFKSKKNKKKPGLNQFVWVSYDSMYDEATALARTGHTASGAPTYRVPDAETYCHEMGHMFGLDDLYTKGNLPTGGFNMQTDDHGGHDPFSCMQLNWIKSAYVPTKSCTITIDDFQSSGDLIVLSPDWKRDKSPFGEYLLIELYSPSGLNKLDANHFTNRATAGIRLWHINGVLSGKSFKYSNSYVKGFYEFEMMTNPKEYRESDSGIARVHFIRKDNEIDSSKKIKYVSSTRMSDSTLFLEKDSFNAYDYRYQLYRYYRYNEYFYTYGYSSKYSQEKIDSMLSKCLVFDNWEEMNWSFTVDKLNYYSASETAQATITITRNTSSSIS